MVSRSVMLTKIVMDKAAAEKKAISLTNKLISRDNYAQLRSSGFAELANSYLYKTSWTFDCFRLQKEKDVKGKLKIELVTGEARPLTTLTRCLINKWQTGIQWSVTRSSIACSNELTKSRKRFATHAKSLEVTLRTRPKWWRALRRKENPVSKVSWKISKQAWINWWPKLEVSWTFLKKRLCCDHSPAWEEAKGVRYHPRRDCHRAVPKACEAEWPTTNLPGVTFESEWSASEYHKLCNWTGESQCARRGQKGRTWATGRSRNKGRSSPDHWSLTQKLISRDDNYAQLRSSG